MTKPSNHFHAIRLHHAGVMLSEPFVRDNSVQRWELDILTSGRPLVSTSNLLGIDPRHAYDPPKTSASMADFRTCQN